MDELTAKRIEELYSRCESRCILTHSGFLTPADSFDIRAKYKSALFFGGGENCDRLMAFFLPEYMPEDELDVSEYISAVRIETKFAAPSHRDFMGSILGLGITRESVGDISVCGDTAYAFMLPQTADYIAMNLQRVGRVGAKTEKIPLSDVPPRIIKKESISFSVMSMRLDAICANMFNLSRTTGAKAVNEGIVSVNYRECLKPDRDISVGDIISVKGHGKGIVTGIGGQSRRGRTFIEADIYK